MDPLADALRATPPAALTKLTPAQRRRLADALSAAQERQAAAIDRAADRGLAFVPRLLRGPIKRLLF